MELRPEIYALAQTTDGFLLARDRNRMFRFDGIRFESYKPQSGQASPTQRVLYSPYQMEAVVAFVWRGQLH